jgi:hypothetical protein
MYIYMQIYAHKYLYIYSLTEDGEVAGKLSTFESVGLLPPSEKLNPVILGGGGGISWKEPKTDPHHSSEGGGLGDRAIPQETLRLQTLIGKDLLEFFMHISHALLTGSVFFK